LLGTRGKKISGGKDAQGKANNRNNALVVPNIEM
jgi:hypothetical protein